MGTIDPKYTTSVTVRGGRQGHAVSDDGALDVQLRVPKTNGKSDGTNPEQLFAAAWAGCFDSALSYVAGQAGVDATNASVKVEIAQVDAAQLRHPQPGAVQQLEDGVVAGRGRAFGVGVLVEQLAKLVGAQHAG